MIPGSGRSPGEGIGYPLKYFGLENSMDCIVHGVAQSWTQLSEFHFNFLFNSKMLIAHLCLTVCDHIDCSPPGFSVHGILQVITEVDSHSLL